MKRIILITPSMTVGGSQRYISEIANYWSVKNKVYLINLRSTGIFYKLNSNIEVFNLSHEWDGLVSKISSGVTTGKEIRNIVKKIEPDFVISTFSPTNILTLMSLSGLKYKIFVRDSFGSNFKRKSLEMNFRKIFYPKASGIIAQNKEIMVDISHKLKCNNIEVIKNPVREIAELNFYEKDQVILTVGELIDRKGHHLLLDSVKHMNLDNWRIVIVGKGANKNKLEKRIKAEKLGNKIKIIPPTPEIDYYYQKASIFIFPSLIEGLPNALLEAMSAGLPCVSFDCDTGPREIIIDGENGFLVPVENTKILASRVNSLINDSELRQKIGQNAKKAMKDYSVEKIIDELEGFIQKS